MIFNPVMTGKGGGVSGVDVKASEDSTYRRVFNVETFKIGGVYQSRNNNENNLVELPYTEGQEIEIKTYRADTIKFTVADGNIHLILPGTYSLPPD